MRKDMDREEAFPVVAIGFGPELVLVLALEPAPEHAVADRTYKEGEARSTKLEALPSTLQLLVLQHWELVELERH